MNKQEFELLVCLFYQFDPAGRSTLEDNLSDYLSWEEFMSIGLYNSYGYLSARTLIRKWKNV